MNLMSRKLINVPYLIFLDEHYYYMAKDKIVNPKHPERRRIGNKYDLFKLNNFQVRKESEDFEFTFEFVTNDVFSRIIKVLYFTPKEAEDFYAVLNVYLGRLGINPPEIREDEEEEGEGEENEEEENEGEEEEGEEEEDNGEEGIEVKNEEDKKEETKKDSNNDNSNKNENNNENNNNIKNEDVKIDVDKKENNENNNNVAVEDNNKGAVKEKQD